MEKVTLNQVLTSVDRYKLFYLSASSKGLGNILSVLQDRKIPIVNVGLELSTFLKDSARNKYLHLEAYEHIKKVLEVKKANVTGSGNEVVSIYNFGILQEPLLELNPAQIFKDFSKSAALII